VLRPAAASLPAAVSAARPVRFAPPSRWWGGRRATAVSGSYSSATAGSSGTLFAGQQSTVNSQRCARPPAGRGRRPRPGAAGRSSWFAGSAGLAWALLLFHSHSQTQKQRLLVEFTKLILLFQFNKE
jgi:hypothetical protein